MPEYIPTSPQKPRGLLLIMMSLIAAMIIMLMFKPYGMFGKRKIERI